MEGQQPAKKARLGGSFTTVVSKVKAQPDIMALVIDHPVTGVTGCYKRTPRLISLILSGRLSQMAPIQEHPDETRLTRPHSR